MSSWGRVYYSNLLAVLPALLLGVAFREYRALRGYVLTMHAFGVLMLSCVCGVAMSYTSYQLRARISATAFTVLGIVAKAGTVLINLAIWDKHAGPGGLAAMSLCLVGGALYVPAPMRKQEQPHGAKAGGAAAAPADEKL